MIALGGKVGSMRTELGHKADDRISKMEEMLNAMQVMKLYCWEPRFIRELVDKRNAEVAIYKKQATLQAILSAFAHLSAPFFLIIIFLVALNLKIADYNGIFQSDTIFAIIMMTVNAQFAIKLISLAMLNMMTIYKANLRIQQALLLPESEERNCFIIDKVTFTNCSVGYAASSSTVLENIDFKLAPGQLIGVIGPVGAGKTALANCFIGESIVKSGKHQHPLNISITTQDPWLFGGSIKDNIIMNSSFNSSRYNKIIGITCLTTDLALLPNGDSTIVGEKGVQLSGGQKARVALARCLYIDADLYIFDDPLAAVDAKVARQIYDNCIKQFLRTKMKILITHQHHLLTDADCVLYIENGRQVACSKYAEIMALKTQFIESLVAEQNKKEEIDTRDTNNSTLTLEKHQTTSVEVEKNEEEISQGLIKWRHMIFYMGAAGSLFLPLFYVIWKICVHGMIVFNEIILGVFAANGDELQTCLETENSVINSTSCVNNSTSRLDESFVLFSCFYTSTFIFDICASVFFYHLIVRLNKNLHTLALSGVIKSPMRFFNTNSVGRLLNRFSQDIGRADALLPLTSYDSITMVLQLIGAFVLAIYVNWLNATLVLPCCAFLVYLRTYYVRTGREIKRLESSSKSPIYNYISETMNGRAVLRANQLESVLVKQFTDLEDNHSSVYLLTIRTRQWLQFHTEVSLTLFFILITIVFVELFRSSLIDINFTAGDIGTTLNTVFNMLNMFSYGITQTIETELNLTSIERLVQFAHLKQELDTVDSDDNNKHIASLIDEKTK